MAVERVIIEITGDTTKIQSTISELEKLGKVDRANSDSFKRTNQQFNDNLNKTKNNLGGFGDQLNSLKQQVIGAFAVSSIVAFGKEAVATAAKIESIGNSLKFITGSSANAEKTMTYLRELSNRLGLEFKSTAQAFKLFAGATTQAGMTLGETKSIFESVSKAVTTMGLSADDANGVFLALSQIMSKGKVSAEELRGQIGERIPGAFSIAAKSIGVTEQQLNKMLEQGQILSKDFLPKFAKQLETDLGGGAERAANGMQANLNRLENMWTGFKNFFGAYIVYPLVAGLKGIFVDTPKMLIDDLSRIFSKKSVFEGSASLAAQFQAITDNFTKLEVRIANAKTKKELETLGSITNKYFNTLDKGMSEAANGQYLQVMDALADKYRSLGVATKTGGKGLDDIIAKFKEFKEAALKADSKQEIKNITRNVKDFFGSLDKSVKPEIKNYLYEILDILSANEKQIGEKLPTAYEKLVKASSDLEAAMRNTLALNGIVSPEAIKQLDDLKLKIQTIEIAMKNLNDPALKNAGGQPLGIKGVTPEQLPSGDFGAAAIKAEEDALMKLQEEYWKDEAEFEKAQKAKTQILQEEADKRKAAEEAFYNQLPQFASQAISIISQYQQQSTDYELQLLDQKLKAKQISDKEYEKERRRLLTKQAQDQKAAAILQATIDIAGSIMSTLKQFGGTPYGIAMASITAGLGAAQLAVIQSQKIPKFKKGTDYVSLNGNPRGEDTIPALLNEGEAIITTEQNAKYPGLAKAWNDGKLDEHIYTKWMTPELILKKSLEREAIDYDRLGQSVADSIKKNPQVKVSFDKSGFATYLIKGNSVINYQNNRYSSK